MHGAVEVGRLAAQEVDPLGRRGGAAEHGRLDLLDVLLEPFQDGRVVVDDLVQDRPQDRGRALLEQLRATLEPQPGAVEIAGHALAHGDHEAAGHEDRHFAELDCVAFLHVAGGAQHGEVDAAVVVLLDLRAQVEALGVLDREIVQAEATLDLGQLGGIGLDHSQPHEPAVALDADLRRLVEVHRTLVLAPAVAVVGTVDNHDPLLPLGPRPVYAFARGHVRGTTDVRRRMARQAGVMRGLVVHRARILAAFALLAIAVGGALHLAGAAATGDQVWRVAVALLAAELAVEVVRTIAVDHHMGVDTIALVAMVGSLLLGQDSPASSSG